MSPESEAITVECIVDEYCTVNAMGYAPLVFKGKCKVVIPTLHEYKAYHNGIIALLTQGKLKFVDAAPDVAPKNEAAVDPMKLKPEVKEVKKAKVEEPKVEAPKEEAKPVEAKKI